jgi:hypothetical protein
VTTYTKVSNAAASFAVVAGLSFWAWGCAGILPPIRLGGHPADLEALVGTWSGEYSGGAGLDRRGRITFSLSADDTVARGGVEMIPRGDDWRYRRNRLPPNRQYQPPVAEFLMITFVRVDENAVSGTLDEYWDPDRMCWTRTLFFGVIRGDVIEGSFRSTSDQGVAPTFGSWRVRRVSSTVASRPKQERR